MPIVPERSKTTHICCQEVDPEDSGRCVGCGALHSERRKDGSERCRKPLRKGRVNHAAPTPEDDGLL